MSAKVVTKHMQSNGQPFKSQVFCRVHRGLNSGSCAC